jgi:hypothetical protein
MFVNESFLKEYSLHHKRKTINKTFPARYYAGAISEKPHE